MSGVSDWLDRPDPSPIDFLAGRIDVLASRIKFIEDELTSQRERYLVPNMNGKGWRVR